MNALEDPEVIEIMLNPDGSLWIEKYGRDHDRIGEIPVAQGRLILSQVASGLNLTVNERSPIVEGEFPWTARVLRARSRPLSGLGLPFHCARRPAGCLPWRNTPLPVPSPWRPLP